MSPLSAPQGVPSFSCSFLLHRVVSRLGPAKSGGLVVSASLRPALVTLAPCSSNPAVPTEVSRESAEVRGSNPDAQEDALTPPGADSLQLGSERRDRNRLDAILGALFQSCQEVARRIAAVARPGEEEIVFRVSEGQPGLHHVTDGHRRHLVDARAAGWSGAREDDLPDQLRFFLRDHLRDETAQGEAK